MLSRKIVPLAGAAGVIGSLSYAIGDVLLFGCEARPEQHPRLEGALGRNKSVLWMLPSSTTRLATGALAGVLASPLQLAAIWHLYQQLAPAGHRRALPALTLLAAGWSVGPFIHGTYLHIAEAYKAIDDNEAIADDPEARAALLRQGQTFRRANAVAYAAYFLGVLGGSVELIRTIRSGATAYPKWSALAVAPVLPVAVATALTASNVLPGKAGYLFQGAGISLGHAFSFAVSTALSARRSGSS